MNAYLIAAKANAWEIDQHVGGAIEANQPDYLIEAIGRGEGSNPEEREKTLGHDKFLGGLFSLN